jgi:hypothetical protein
MRLNLLATKFTVQRGSRKSIVWDVSRFFQCSFVKALRTWRIASDEQTWRKVTLPDGSEVETTDEIEAIARLKDDRGNFAAIGPRERAYCQSECRLLAMLVRELLDAHESEGLRLKNYFGPGSTAALVLTRCGAKSQAAAVPDAMAHAVDSAFFGGRFEVSHVGPVEGPLFSYDIASAYPYALALLPCLHPEHGRWKHCTGRAIDVSRDSVATVYSYRLRQPRGAFPAAWGVLPHRLPDGNIVFPRVSAGGWAWQPEIREALFLHGGLDLLESWSWHSKCDCQPPFQDEVVRLFCRRLEMGKATRGLVVKLALNSMYGKSAQSVGGGGAFRCMVRAGLITSMTRAMLLQATSLVSDPWDILELATDSVLSRVPLDSLPAPERLGTEDAARLASARWRDKRSYPLGAWEGKVLANGAMLLRPGLRFELGPEARIGRTAARGVGVKTLHDNRAKVLAAWRDAPMMPTEVQQPAMFHGSRVSVRRVAGDVDFAGEMMWRYVRDKLYGRWEPPKPRVLSYEPGPKRDGVSAGFAPGVVRLHPFTLPMTADARSCAYSGAAGGMFDGDNSDLLAAQPEMGLDAAL